MENWWKTGRQVRTTCAQPRGESRSCPPLAGRLWTFRTQPVDNPGILNSSPTGYPPVVNNMLIVSRNVWARYPLLQRTSTTITTGFLPFLC